MNNSCKIPSAQLHTTLTRCVSVLDLMAAESLITARIAVRTSDTVDPRWLKMASFATVPSVRKGEERKLKRERRR